MGKEVPLPIGIDSEEMMHEVDQDDEPFCAGVDGCHHGLGWDEPCEDCEAEDAEDRAAERRRKALQKNPDLFDGDGSSDSGDGK